MKTETIHSLKELQLRMPAIIKEYGNDNSLTLIALANPIIALERTGLKFTDQAKEEIETHARFGKEGASRYNELRKEISKTAGRNIDLKNHEHLEDLVAHLSKPADAAGKHTQTKKTAYLANTPLEREKLLTALQSQPKKINGQWKDSLHAFASLHPLVPLLIEYRRMDVENPGFAHPKDISHIEDRLLKSPFKNVVFSLRRTNNKSLK